MNNATTYIQPLRDQIATSAKSGTPDVDTIQKINAVISTTAEQLTAAPPVDLSGLGTTNLQKAIAMPALPTVVNLETLGLVSAVLDLVDTSVNLVRGIVRGGGGGLDSANKVVTPNQT